MDKIKTDFSSFTFIDEIKAKVKKDIAKNRLRKTYFYASKRKVSSNDRDEHIDKFLRFKPKYTEI